MGNSDNELRGNPLTVQALSEFCDLLTENFRKPPIIFNMDYVSPKMAKLYRKKGWLDANNSLTEKFWAEVEKRGAKKRRA